MVPLTGGVVRTGGEVGITTVLGRERDHLPRGGAETVGVGDALPGLSDAIPVDGVARLSEFRHEKPHT